MILSDVKIYFFSFAFFPTDLYSKPFGSTPSIVAWIIAPGTFKTDNTVVFGHVYHYIQRNSLDLIFLREQPAELPLMGHYYPFCWYQEIWDVCLKYVGSKYTPGNHVACNQKFPFFLNTKFCNVSSKCLSLIPFVSLIRDAISVCYITWPC